MTQSDTQLVQDVLDGDKQAFAMLVQRYERSVRAAAMNIVKKANVADDIAQEAFVRSWQQLSRLQDPTAFGPWLMTITRRCAIDWLRKHQRVNYTNSLDLTAAYERNGRLDEDKEYLLAAIQKLPESERQVIMLRYFGPCTVRDLATIVGRSVGTVTKQLSRAHQHLKSRLLEIEK